MNSKLNLQLSVSDPQPASIAAFLNFLNSIENQNPNFELLVACHNASQAGQVRRRIRECLKNGGIDPDKFEFRHGNQASYFEVGPPSSATVPDSAATLPVSDRGEREPDTPLFQTTVDASRTSSELENSEATSDEPTGKFAALIVDVAIEEFPAASFFKLRHQIESGPFRGRFIDDRVQVRPESLRTHHLAFALGTTVEELARSREQMRGKRLQVHRQWKFKPDGSSILKNFYFPSANQSHEREAS